MNNSNHTNGQVKQVPNQGRNFPPEHPNLFQKLSSYLLVNAVVVPTVWGFMNLLNHTKITGRDNLRNLKRPWILMSNHVTLLDDLFIGPLVFGPNTYRGYRFIPYHAPEELNFYSKLFVRWFMRNTKSIPVMRGKGIYQEGVTRLIKAVKEGGVLHIYPEGTRTRTGDIGKAKSGIGRIIYESGATIVPMYHTGLEKILPIGSGIPKIGRKTKIAIGKPLQFSEELKLENNPETWKLMTSQVMDAIREQREVVYKKWGVAPPIKTNA